LAFLIAFALTVPLALAQPLVAPSIAGASYYNCDTPAAEHFATWGSNLYPGSQPTQWEGVGAMMRVEFGNICQTDSNANVNTSSTWDMVVGHDFQGWAQSGIILRPGYSCWPWWAEDVIPGEQNVDWYNGGCAVQSTTHHVYQQLVTVNGSYAIRSNVDGIVIHQTEFNPFTSWALPFQVQFAGETHHDNSDIPGYAAAPTDFSTMQVQNAYNNNWYGTCDPNWGANLGKTAPGVPAPRYSDDALACDHVRTWTSG
jgi:hypothetical protein